ncbi:MAG: hypothetical protein WAU32_00990 [Thermoanaerobaculia bacterium]
MTKDLRAIVLGLFVVVLAAIALSFWRRPAPEFRSIRSFKVEVTEKDGDATRHASFSIPSGLVAGFAKLAPMSDIKANLEAEWAKGNVTPRDILDAAEEAKPGAPGVIKKDDATIEVQAEGDTLVIDVKDAWDKHVHVRVPRTLVEGLDERRALSTSEVLRGLDELGPGDIVSIKDGDSEVTITAVPRKRRLTIS